MSDPKTIPPAEHAGLRDSPGGKANAPAGRQAVAPSAPADPKTAANDQPAKITKGYELVRKLKESGTGEAKLAVCRKALMLNPAATATEIISALRNDGSVRQATIDKAEALRVTGEWNAAAEYTAVVAPIEERLAALDAVHGSLPGVPIEDLLGGTDPLSAGDRPPATGSHVQAAEIPTGQTVKIEYIGKTLAAKPPTPAEKAADKKK